MSLKIRAAQLLCVVGLGVLSAQASAINCQKAGTQAEKLICSDRKAVAADAELNRAYAALLKQAPDDDIRTAIKDGQRQWVDARDRALERVAGNPDSLQDDDATPGSIAAKLIAARTADLKAHPKNSNTPAMIGQALRQREFRKQFTGGPYSGYEVSCDVLPPYEVYGCFATRHYQNNDRVCSVDDYWATGSVYVQRYVAKLVDNKPVPVASCSFNGNDANCPGSIADDARWNTGPEVHKVDYPTSPLAKLAVDINDSDDYEWLQACLTDKTFPLANPASAGR